MAGLRVATILANTNGLPYILLRTPYILPWSALGIIVEFGKLSPSSLGTNVIEMDLFHDLW